MISEYVFTSIRQTENSEKKYLEMKRFVAFGFGANKRSDVLVEALAVCFQVRLLKQIKLTNTS